jgi:hypothetical protein
MSDVKTRNAAIQAVPLPRNRTHRTNRDNRTDEVGGAILDDLHAWLKRFIITTSPDDLALLTLWCAHTHFIGVIPSTPRLLLDSVMPGSGKTTALEHLRYLAMDPVQMSAISSPALLVRMLAERPRTLLIDEVDRVLDPKKDTTGDLVAVLNSGYKQGATRPVLVPQQGGGWAAQEMPTFAPVALAGNSPKIPDDTAQRSIRVVLMPDVDGEAEDSDWEKLEPAARELRLRLEAWAERDEDTVRGLRPALPEGCRGRMREVWSPLARVAAAAGGAWPDVATVLIEHALDEQRLDQRDGLDAMPPAVRLLRDLRTVFERSGSDFMPTRDILADLAFLFPTDWGEQSTFGRPLTAQRLGRMLVKNYRVHTIRRPDDDRSRGYRSSQFARAWRRILPSGSDTSTSTSGSEGEGHGHERIAA